ncbi:MAG: VWA domain-containing protein [Acidobacteria bacterium]|nr:VWA domain-containing protein [Acidobacteriota bacterium]
MRTKDKRLLLACLLGSFCFAALGVGQERPRTVERQGSTTTQDPAEEVVRVNTRVVFIDTLVKDKRTGEPVEGLTREDFEVLDNGKPRPISYFSREGSGDKRPLALLIVLAPLDDGARKSLQAPEVVNSLAAALAKLPLEDEVALMLVWRHGTGHMLADLTRDRAKVSSTLTGLPKRDNTKTTVRAPKVIQDAALAIALQRPRSQTRVVLVTDTVFLIQRAERDEMIGNLVSANVTFNALITGTNKYLALLAPALEASNNDLTENYDVPQYMAKETGGDYLRARKKKDYGPALEKLIGNLTARYNLGFTLSESELDDKHMHRLEVRVRARDSQGKERKVEVSARQGYYMPMK